MSEDKKEAVPVFEGPQWYVVHTYSGYENKVKMNIEAMVENRHLEDYILEVRIPMQDVSEIKDGKEVTKSKKMFPGYVMIHMVMNDDTWYVVRNTRGVTGFVGPKSQAVPLTQEEVMSMCGEKPVVEFDIEVGDHVIVQNGAMKDTTGVVLSINEQKQTVQISVNMFGMETTADLDVTDVKKL